jgi:hypothetical protein
MTDYPFTAEDLDALKAWDTPTICNASRSSRQSAAL